MFRLLFVCSACALRVPGTFSRTHVTHSALLAAGLTLSPAAIATDRESAASTRNLLKEARAQLEPCANLIAESNWDGVRNVVKTSPLVNVPKLVTRYISEVGEAAEDLVVPREDFVQAIQLLDMNVYNNVFINEQNGQGARGKGVKVDRDTPLQHLAETKAALDEIIAFQS